MADDDLDEDFDAETIEEEIDEDAIDEDTIEDEAIVDDVLADDDALVETEELEETDETVVVEEPVRAKKRKEEEEEDEEELDPDDVEADLDTILKDRIAAADEEEDEDELDEQPRATVESPNGVIPKRANEFMCTGCFLLVNRGQFGPENAMQCPVGESECPAIRELQSTPPAKPVKASRKR